MDHSQTSKNFLDEGIKHYINDEFELALNIFTELMTNNQNSFEARLYRAITYLQIKKFENALNDLNEAEKFENKSFFELYFRKGIALFHLERFLESNEYFKKALVLQTSQGDRNKLAIWANKLEIELTERDLMPTVDSDNINLENIKFNHNWYQNATHLTLSLESNTAIEKEKFDFNFEKKSLKIIHRGNKRVIFEMNLSNGIIPDQSKVSVNNRRIEFVLKKEVENFNWISVDKKKIDESSSVFKSTYPTSSKVKKDWDNLEKEINQELVSDAKNDPNEGMMKLFKDIYERSDENTRRAMTKSFQTSGGTVLSTNWGEVKEKDYEGKDRPEAPKGQEWGK